MKLLYPFFVLIFSLFFLTQCARRGNPTGGKKDETAPVMVTANPPYETTNFSSKKIKIYFDEYIVLKDLNKQLIISPPLKKQPVITPQGTPSKYIQIKLQDEKLQPNTTYTFNFGSAVQDNNENNKLESFKYVFSTGKQIDSLTLKGKVTDAFLGKLKRNSSVLLYRFDSTYNDSIVYKQKPNYLAITKDSLNFKFSNLREGKYMIVALNETIDDYIFNFREDKIGFLKQSISIPDDSVLTSPLKVFKEEQLFKFKRGKNVSKGRINFHYIGKSSDLKLELLSKVPSTYKSFTQIEKDSVKYWFTPIKVDSLVFKVSHKNFTDTISVKLYKKKIDSLKVDLSINGSLNITDTLFVITNNPVLHINDSLFSLVDKDTLEVQHSIKKLEKNKIGIFFKQSPKNKYSLRVLPDALSDIYKTANDSLFFDFYTKDLEDYGVINLKIDNKTNSNLIIDLLNGEKIIKTKFVSSTAKNVIFKNLLPMVYQVRAIADRNNNKVWDTGNYLKKIQPEPVIYLPEEISLRANWTIDNVFVVE